MAYAGTLHLVEKPLEELEEPLHKRKWQERSIELVRETHIKTLQERWAIVKAYRDQLTMENTVAMIENYQNEERIVLSQQTAISCYIERLIVWFCVNFHPHTRYMRGDQYYMCQSCRRRFAVAWLLDTEKFALDPNVYISDFKLDLPTQPTKQAECRNGLR